MPLIISLFEALLVFVLIFFSFKPTPPIVFFFSPQLSPVIFSRTKPLLLQLLGVFIGAIAPFSLHFLSILRVFPISF